MEGGLDPGLSGGWYSSAFYDKYGLTHSFWSLVFALLNKLIHGKSLKDIADCMWWCFWHGPDHDSIPLMSVVMFVTWSKLSLCTIHCKVDREILIKTWNGLFIKKKSPFNWVHGNLQMISSNYICKKILRQSYSVSKFGIIFYTWHYFFPISI